MKLLHLRGKGQRRECIVSFVHGSGLCKDVIVTDMYTDKQSFRVYICRNLCFILLLISLIIMPLNSSKSIPYRTYLLAPCQACNNELASVAEVT